MKFFPFVLLAFLIVSCAVKPEIPSERDYSERVYFDEEGNSMSQSAFQERWRNKKWELARWDEVKNGKRIISLSSPLYTQYSVDYLPLLRNLERITGQAYSPNSVLVLSYNFKDDLCSSRSSNTWNKAKIRARKSFLRPTRKKVLSASENVVYLYLFEEGIVLKNKPDSKKEYFFQDQNNFLRKSIFKHPTLCGSHALIKPNGQALVRNGEWRADMLLPLLQPEYWNEIFPLKE